MVKVVSQVLLIICCPLAVSAESALATDESRGIYFEKRAYQPQELPAFAGARDGLPSPVLGGNPGWVDMYWKCWEIAFRGLKQPPPGSPLVSNWLDEAFSGHIFQWDTIFMMMFARYGHEMFPAIQSLNNFYCLQRRSGFIGREYREADGAIIHFDHGGGLFAPTGWKNVVNPPLFSWAEFESYRVTGDRARLAMVLPVLEKYAEWLDREGDPDAEDWETHGRKAQASVHGLYWNTPLGSGMDNTPRPAQKGAGWVEMSAQMVIMYANLALICDQLELADKAHAYRSRATAIGELVNRWCWSEEDGFYYDVRADGSQFTKKTSGGFWPLLAGIASPGQAERLVQHLRNQNEFWRAIVFPTLAADEEEYAEYGGYWLGGVWAPTNVMVIKGLEKYGFEDLAAEATERYLAGMYAVFKETGTVFENYSPEHLAPGRPAKPDFVGWTGCGPIQLLIENVIGLRPEAAGRTLTWRLRRSDRHGVRRLPVGESSVSLICERRSDPREPAQLTVECGGPCRLVIEHPAGTKSFDLGVGTHRLQAP